MKIAGTPGLTGPLAAAPAPEIQATAPKAAATGAVTAPAAGELQSTVLQPAMAALREMPDIDHAKVEALRDALARGELPFDAGKLAGLIERFHGSKG